VHSFRGQYQYAPKREDKSRITNEIIQLVESEGGRFLRTDDETGDWVLVDAAGAHEKVSHALRNAKESRKVRGIVCELGGLSFTSNHEQAKFKRLSSLQQSIFEDLLKSDQPDDESSCADK
jgi:nucleoside-triphosphatase THEP1